MPDGYVKTMRYNKETPIQDRMNLVQEHILNRWEDYFHEYWLKESGSGEMSINYSKNILDRCATFILLADMRASGVLSKYKIDSINSKEIQMSSATGNVANLLYGGESAEGEGDKSGNVSAQLTKEESYKDPINLSLREIENLVKKEEKKKKRWQESKTRKFFKLHSTKEVTTYKLITVKEAKCIIYSENKIDTITVENEDKKPLKNVYGQPILDVLYHKIGGHKGMIGLNQPYTSEWCVVDTDNKFIYNGNTFIIDKSVKQYEVFDDNQSSMDKILCIFVNDTLNFFDMNIDEVSSKLIKQV